MWLKCCLPLQKLSKGLLSLMLWHYNYEQYSVVVVSLPEVLSGASILCSSAIFRTSFILPEVYSTLDLNVSSKCTDAALRMGAKNSYYSRSNNLFESRCLNSQAVVSDWDMHSFSAGEKPPQQILFCSWQIWNLYKSSNRKKSGKFQHAITSCRSMKYYLWIPLSNSYFSVLYFLHWE